MKISCENCQKDINAQIQRKFEQFEVGYVTCKECNKNQARYISESDILLYFGISELLYLFLSVVTLLSFYYIGISLYLIPVFLIFLIIGYIIQKRISIYIYVNAPFKKDYMYKSFKEDKQQIQRSTNWQFILFFALAITAVTGTSFQLFFLVISLIAIMITFIKFFACIKKERSQL